MKKIIYEHDGKLAVLTPAPEYVDYLRNVIEILDDADIFARVAEKDLPPDTQYEIVDNIDVSGPLNGAMDFVPGPNARRTPRARTS